MKDLIQWHRERADELDDLADKSIRRANDGRSSRFTRRHNLHAAGVHRGIADRHRETIAALQELTANRERLEWMEANDGRWDNINGILSYGWSTMRAVNLREAIDKARHG